MLVLRHVASVTVCRSDQSRDTGCRNMDIVGVAGVEAEAECLSAIVHLLQRLGLSAQDIVIRVSSRRVLAALVSSFGVPADTFGAVCIVVDKLDKLPADKVRAAESQAVRAPKSSAVSEVGQQAL